jgi:uncharacterized protein YktB (UPF0637 family)
MLLLEITTGALMELFTQKDFKVFDIPDFRERMQAISERIRPKLKSIGEALAPAVSGVVDQPLYLHVAKHARRTVNPPDDTWAALGADKRGYKKDVHFKIAVSRNCVRFLFEVGPEYYDKAEWALRWNRERKDVVETLHSAPKLSWFKSEHDEDPAAFVARSTPEELMSLVGELTRRKRDGQLVLGRRLDGSEVRKMDPARFRRIALGTFKPLATLFTLHDQRILA